MYKDDCISPKTDKPIDTRALVKDLPKLITWMM